MLRICMLFIFVGTTIFAQSPFVEFGGATMSMFIANFANQIENLRSTVTGIKSVATGVDDMLDVYRQTIQSVRKIANIPAELKNNFLGLIHDGEEMINSIYGDVEDGIADLRSIATYYENFLDYTAEDIPKERLVDRMNSLEAMMNKVAKRAGKGIGLVEDIINRANRIQQALKISEMAGDAESTLAVMQAHSDMFGNMSESMDAMLMQLAVMNENIALSTEEKIITDRLSEEVRKELFSMPKFNPFTDKKVRAPWSDFLTKETVENYLLEEK